MSGDTRVALDSLTLWSDGFWAVIGVMVVGALVTYAWRGAGVALSGRLNTGSPLFVWVSCVAYALLAALIARMIVLPIGPLTETSLLDRLLAAAAALGFFFGTRRNILVGTLGGALVLVLLVWWRGGGLAGL
jgi:branched-subunit amino acid transport protein